MEKKGKIIGIFIAAIFAIAVIVAVPVEKVEATNGVEVQIAMILDGSGSIGSGNWDIIKEGVASAVEDPMCVPHDGTVELTVVHFAGDMPVPGNAIVEVGPVVITSANAATVAGDIRVIPYYGGLTPMAYAIHLAADTLNGSPNFDPSIKQVINLATDGVPNVLDPAFPSPDPLVNTEQARDYAIFTALQMTEDQDEFDAEGIGDVPDINWLRDSIVYPQPGTIAPPFTPGWVRQVADADEFAATVCEKFVVIIEPTPTPTPTPEPTPTPTPEPTPTPTPEPTPTPTPEPTPTPTPEPTPTPTPEPTPTPTPTPPPSEVSTLTPTGLIALVGLLSAVAAMSISIRKKRR